MDMTERLTLSLPLNVLIINESQHHRMWHAISCWDPFGIHLNGSYKAGESITIIITLDHNLVSNCQVFEILNRHFKLKFSISSSLVSSNWVKDTIGWYFGSIQKLWSYSYFFLFLSHLTFNPSENSVGTIFKNTPNLITFHHLYCSKCKV